jgi:DNA-binding transcriptional LysR family regulator
MLPRHSALVASKRTSLTIAEAAELPLILPTSTHGLRRRISAEFEQRNLSAHVVAEIDSLSLLMNCVYDGMGATIKPMEAATAQFPQERISASMPLGVGARSTMLLHQARTPSATMSKNVNAAAVRRKPIRFEAEASPK